MFSGTRCAFPTNRTILVNTAIEQRSVKIRCSFLNLVSFRKVDRVNDYYLFALSTIGEIYIYKEFLGIRSSRSDRALVRGRRDAR